jgi:hypothetical protein
MSKGLATVPSYSYDDTGAQFVAAWAGFVWNSSADLASGVRRGQLGSLVFPEFKAAVCVSGFKGSVTSRAPVRSSWGLRTTRRM